MSVTTSARCSGCEWNSETGDFAFQRCGACKISTYCSKDCQRRDWKAGHKQQCKSMPLINSVQTTAAQHTGGVVKGVRLACAKEPGAFFEVDIPSDHSIFDGPLLEVPAILGTPLVVHRVGTQSNDRADLDCQIATFLNITYENGMAPPQWQSHVGSCLVARKDKKPLSSQHLEAVWMYIDRILDYFNERGPEGARKIINRGDFEKWLKNLQEGRGFEWTKGVGECRKPVRSLMSPSVAKAKASMTYFPHMAAIILVQTRQVVLIFTLVTIRLELQLHPFQYSVCIGI